MKSLLNPPFIKGGNMKKPEKGDAGERNG